MLTSESLREDHAAISQILECRRAVTTETLPPGLRVLWTIYILVLEDALKTLNSLISHLTPKEQ